MAKRKRLLPFGALPAAWGLSGKSRALAEAEYYFDGEELSRKKLDINISEMPMDDVHLAHLRLDLKYNKITEEDFDRKEVAITIKDEKQRDLALLEIDKKHGRVSESDYERKKAVLNDEAFVRVAKI